MSTLDKSTFDYLQPTDEQKEDMQICRDAARQYGAQLDEIVPDGEDKDFILRSLRTLSMWVNVAITREQDGSPRE